MPKGVRSTSNKESIEARRQQLQAELANLEEAERRLSEAERDAGRAPFLAALGRVKIGAMDKAAARTIARTIESEGGDAVAARVVMAFGAPERSEG